jgi:cytoskeletal protein CcmA (bactofilin family)
MFGKSKRARLADEARLAEKHQERLADEREMITQIISEHPAAKGSAVAGLAGSVAPEATSSIGSGLSIVGKIVGEGTLRIFGRVQGEVRASAVEIGNGAQIEGDIVAEELTISGRVKGTIHANSVTLSSSAVVEGDIYHRSLAIEKNAQFEGMSRRQENAIDTPSLVPANRSSAIGANGQDTSAPDGLNASQTRTTPIDSNGGSNRSDA